MCKYLRRLHLKQGTDHNKPCVKCKRLAWRLPKEYKIGSMWVQHTCRDKRMLLQLSIGKSLLIVQDTGIENGTGTIAFFKCLSLW